MKNREKKVSPQFKERLRELINMHSVENIVDMPDFLMAEMLCGIIETIGANVKLNLDWHGCNSVCHPRKKKGGR
jgi:hypothetical protein